MIIFAQSTLTRIQASIGHVAPESGGILGSRNGVISEFYYDYSGITDKNYYMPSDEVDKIIRQWNLMGYTFEGFIHSHTNRFSPTNADIDYSLKVLRWYEEEFKINKDTILIPLVKSTWSFNAFHIYGFSVNKEKCLMRCEICIANPSKIIL